MVKTIGNLISSQRIKLGLTQKAVADHCGVSEGTVSRWESGDIDNMRRDRIASLAQILHISPLLLLGTDTGNVSVKYHMDYDASSPMHALAQAFWRRPAIVQAEAIRRLESLDTTFSQNVSKLLKASGHIDDFMKETGLGFDAVGKFMQGEPVRTTPEEAERIADYFGADIVEMFFGEIDPADTSYRADSSPERKSIEGLIRDELEQTPQDTYTYDFLVALDKYTKLEPHPSYDKTQSALNFIKGLDFEPWLTKVLNGVEKKQPHRFEKSAMLDLLAKRLYQNPTMFNVTYTRNANPVKNLALELIKESDIKNKAAPKGGREE